MKKVFNKKTLIYFLSFLIPILIIWGYIVIKEIMSNGHFFYKGNSFLMSDAGSQYNFLHYYFHNVLVGKDSIFYSFYNTLGGNMASTIGYYLSSPFNILYGFVSKSNIPFMTSIIYSLKVALSSLFVGIFLNYKYGQKFTNIIFSLTYAFMGFITVYYFNSMWLDVIYMTPLVILGIDKLIDGKPLMYIITLCLTIIFNFYIAYMLCIFCLIYFIYELFTKYNIKESKKYDYIVKRFFISSLLAVGLSAFFLLPVILNLKETLRYPIDTSRLSINIKDFFKNFIDNIISKTYINSHGIDSILGRKRPVIYINLFSLVLSCLYLFNSKIKKKERILSIIVIGIFLLSFMIPYLQLIWQGFSFPNGYIDRYSFLYCFFLIFLATKQFYSKSLPKIRYIIIFFAIYILLSLILMSRNLLYVFNKNVIVSIILVGIYLIFYIFNTKFRNKILKTISLVIIVLVVSVELIYNYKTTFLTVGGATDEVLGINELCYKVKDNNNFYRIDAYSTKTYLESFICDYYTSKSALSTNNGKLHKYMYNNGASLEYMYTAYDNDILPIFASLTSNKYLYGLDELNSNFYEEIESYNQKVNLVDEKLVHVYKNPYSLNIGFAVDDNYDKNYRKNKKENNTSFDNLNNLFVSLSGVEKDVLIKIDKLKIRPLDYKFHIDKDTDYIYATTDYEEVINFEYYSPVYVNDKHIITLDTYNVGMFEFKNKYYGQDIILSLDDNTLINDMNLYYFDKEVFEEGINKLKKHQLKNVKLNGNKLNANIDLDKDSTVFISIPYDKGWKVYVDGKKSKSVKIADMFMGIKVPKGKHKISMKFYPRGLKLGIIISITSLCLIIYFKRKEVVVNVKKNKRKNNK